MKTLLFAAATVLLASCASTVPFTIQSTPAGATKEQVQLDNLTCSNMSQTNGPWMYGIGTAIIKAEAAKRYEKCMSDKGYVVQRGSAPSSAVPKLPPNGGVGDAASEAFQRIHHEPSQANDASTDDTPATTQPEESAAASPPASPIAPSAPAASEATSSPASSLAPASPAKASSPGSPASRLEELDKLYKAGLITKKEYEQKRREILATL